MWILSRGHLVLARSLYEAEHRSSFSDRNTELDCEAFPDFLLYVAKSRSELRFDYDAQVSRALKHGESIPMVRLIPNGSEKDSR